MSHKTKTPASAATLASGEATNDRHGTASLRPAHSTTRRGRAIVRGQLCLMFDEALPRPQDLQRFGTQRNDILNYLLDGKSLTQDISRYLFGVMRLASRVCELRQAGWLINRRMVHVGENGARVAEYWVDAGRSRLEALQ